MAVLTARTVRGGANPTRAANAATSDETFAHAVATVAAIAANAGGCARRIAARAAVTTVAGESNPVADATGATLAPCAAQGSASAARTANATDPVAARGAVSARATVATVAELTGVAAVAAVAIEISPSESLDRLSDLVPPTTSAKRFRRRPTSCR